MDSTLQRLRAVYVATAGHLLPNYQFLAEINSCLWFSVNS